MIFTDDQEEFPLSEGYMHTASEDLSIWVERFIEQCMLDAVSEKTIKSYKEALEPFIDFSKMHVDTTIEEISARYINRYLQYYQNRLVDILVENKKIESTDLEIVKAEIKKSKLGKNDANFYIAEQCENSLLHRSTVLKMFLKFISEKNQEEIDYTKLFRNIVKINISEKDTKHLTAEELDEIVNFISEWTSKHKRFKPRSEPQHAYRDALLLLLYAYTGARSEEVVLIRLEDITELTHNKKRFYAIKIKHGKGGKTRSIAVLKTKISKYIDYLRENLPSEKYYISSIFEKGIYINKPYHQDNIRKFSNYILNDALGIKKTGLHVFRRSYATKRLTKDNINIALVAKELGHSVAMLEQHYFKHDVTDSIQE